MKNDENSLKVVSRKESILVSVYDEQSGEKQLSHEKAYTMFEHNSDIHRTQAETEALQKMPELGQIISVEESEVSEQIIASLETATQSSLSSEVMLRVQTYNPLRAYQNFIQYRSPEGVNLLYSESVLSGAKRITAMNMDNQWSTEAALLRLVNSLVDERRFLNKSPAVRRQILETVRSEIAHLDSHKLIGRPTQDGDAFEFYRDTTKSLVEAYTVSGVVASEVFA